MRESFVFLADGFEEVEALTVVDVLRRAGMPVKTVSISNCLSVAGAHGIQVNADVLFDSTLFADPAWLILPGGLPGADNLHDFAPLIGLLKRQAASKSGRIAAICASPGVVLGVEGMLAGRKATCYPGFEHLLNGDDKFVLANGPSSALLWALAIVREELGTEKSDSVAAGMLFYPVSDDQLDNIFG